MVSNSTPRYRRTEATWLVVCLGLLASPVRAFLDPPWITPAFAVEGDMVSVNIRGGECDGVIEWPG